MDQLWAAAEGDSSGDLRSDADDREAEDEPLSDEVAEEEEEEEEEGDEEEEEQRPAKRLRGKQLLTLRQNLDARRAQGQGSLNEDEGNDVIEILSEDEDLQESRAWRANTSSVERQDAASATADTMVDLATSGAMATSQQRNSRAGLSNGVAAPWNMTSRQQEAVTSPTTWSDESANPGGFSNSALQGGARWQSFDADACTMATRSSAVNDRFTIQPCVTSSQEIPPAGANLRKISPAEQAAGGPWKVGSTSSPAKSSLATPPADKDFPMSLECAICFNPLAIVALFACGHGSCWECAHAWCSKGTSPTMDCPTCHVSIPRNDFRRCIVLDGVVEREVKAVGLDSQEWKSRLERGQALAKEAEAQRRYRRDAQRSAEDTIAKQAAELEKLREEVRSHGQSRWRRMPEVHRPMADYRMRTSNRNAAETETRRSVTDEFARSVNQRRAEDNGVNRAVFVDATLGISSPLHYGLPGHARIPSTSPASASGGPAFMSEPWFSLRPPPGRGPVRGAERDFVASASLAGDGNIALGTRVVSQDLRMAGIRAGGDRASVRPVSPSVRKSIRTANPTSIDPSSRGRPRIPMDLPFRGASATYARAGVPRGPPGAERRPSGQSLLPRASTRKRSSSRASSVRYDLDAPSGASGVSAAAGSPLQITDQSRHSAFEVDQLGPLVLQDQDQKIGVNMQSESGRLAAREGDATESDLDAFDMIARHEEFGARAEWDDVLARVSYPQQAAAEAGVQHAQSQG